MSWNKIVGHEKVKRILQNLIVSNRVGHAYCFTGIEGIGKDAAAFQFAKTLNCENQIIIDSYADSCDNCHSCKAFDHLSHPNLDIIFSLPAGKSGDSKDNSSYENLSQEQIDLIKEEIENKAQNNYLPIKIPNATQIKIASIRDIKYKLSLSSFNGRRRFVIILNANEMNQEASNAFLKTLEEPHENITIILITSMPESLLPTILSRCQQINFSPLGDNYIIRKLVLDDNIDEVDARLAAKFAQGSYLKALEFASSNNRMKRNEIVDILRASLKKHSYREDLMSKLENLIKSKDKNQINKSMQLLMFWLNDIAAIKSNANINMLVNFDDITTLEKFHTNFGSKNIALAIDEIENGIKMIYRNVAVNLVLITLFLKLRQIFID